MRHTSLAYRLIRVTALAAAILSGAGVRAADKSGAVDDLADRVDRALLDAILQDDPTAFEGAISAGADPNRIFGVTESDWALCAATQRGRERYLVRLLESGADPNLTDERLSKFNEYPSTCSMIHGNADAFDSLVHAGADLNVRTCRRCGPRLRHSLLIFAMSTGNTKIGHRLLHKIDISETDRQHLAQMLRRRTAPPGSLDARYLWDFSDYLADYGIESEPLVPRP